jgi:hypothetical protein
MVVEAALNELMLAVGVGATVVVVVLLVVVVVVGAVVVVVVPVGTVVVVVVVVVVLLVVVVPVGTVVVVVVVDVLVVVLGSVVPGGILTTPAGTVVVVPHETMIHFCAVVPFTHFLVVRITDRVFELLQIARVPVEDGIDTRLVPDWQRAVFATKSCLVMSFSQMKIFVGVLAGTYFFDPVAHRFLMAAVTTPNLLLTHTETVELPSARSSWERKRNTRVRAKAAPSIRRDMTPDTALLTACCTGRI